MLAQNSMNVVSMSVSNTMDRRCYSIYTTLLEHCLKTLSQHIHNTQDIHTLLLVCFKGFTNEGFLIVGTDIKRTLVPTLWQFSPHVGALPGSHSDSWSMNISVVLTKQNLSTPTATCFIQRFIALLVDVIICQLNKIKSGWKKRLYNRCRSHKTQIRLKPATLDWGYDKMFLCCHTGKSIFATLPPLI